MVKSSCTVAVAFAAICLTFAPGRACADDNGILGQIETQVAGIASRNSRGVVTIEDFHSIEQEDNWKAAFSTRRRGLRHQLVDALSRKADADLQIAVLNKTGKSTGAAMSAVVKTRAAVVLEIDSLRADMAKNPDVARMNVDVDQGLLDVLNARKAKLDVEAEQLSAVHKANSAAMVPVAAARAALAALCSEVQSQLTSDRAKLQSQATHFDIPRIGTGFSIGDGLILTTADVLDGMSEPVIITETGERMRTRVLGVDNETNIGLLHVNSELSLPALLLGNSALVAPGHFAVCIGNQAGSTNSVALSTISGVRTDGIFSGRRFYPSLLQISGPVVPGNSGAPVLNSSGQVIGMVVAVPVSDWTPSALSSFGGPRGAQASNTPPGPGGAERSVAARTASDNTQGGQNRPVGMPGLPFFRSSAAAAGYAMPIDAARPIIADFKAGKPAQHCWIGVSVSSQFSHSALPDRLDLIRTVTVNGLYPDSPAHKAGVQLGDQIVSINGRPTREEVDVRIVSMQSRPGDSIQIELLRGPAHTRVVINAQAEIRPAKFPKPIVAEKK